MKVLLCLLSEQHVPNLLSVHHYEPDQLVLVESDAMRRTHAAENFLAALKMGRLDYGSKHHVQSLSAEHDLKEIRDSLQEAYGRFPSATWIANLTGGTKPMSIATYEFFKALGGKTVYTNLSQPEQIADLETSDIETFGHQLSVEEFVTGYGFQFFKATAAVGESVRRAMQPDWRRSALLLASHASGSDVLILDDDERNKARKKGIELPIDRFSFPCDELRSTWLGKASSRTLTKYESGFLTGGWLEVFTYNLLDAHQKALGIWGVTLGQSIGRKMAQGPADNDVDVCFMHSRGLVMLECKSGGQQHKTGAEQLLTFEGMAKQLRASRVRTVLVTTGDNVLDAQGKLRENIQARSELLNCTIIKREQIRTLAEAELSNSSSTHSMLKEFLGL